MISNYQNTKFITGFRAYAALGVFMIHCGGFGFRNFGSYANNFVDFGSTGVIVFFVVSAFTVSMSVDRERNFLFKKYILKRFFRIAPMYYLVLILAFFLGGNLYYLKLFNVSNSLFSLLFHASFLNWLNFRYQNNLIGVEWSVPIEFSYYLVIPFALFFFKRYPGSVLIGLLLAAIVSSTGYLIYQKINLPVLAYHWSLLKYLFSFMFGIFIYLIFREDNFFKKFNYASLLITLLLIIFGIYVLLGFQYHDMFATMFIGLLILTCKQKTKISVLLFENKIIMFLGEISYSIYLVHMLILDHVGNNEGFINPLVMLTLTIIVSTATYFLIEKPFIRLGKKMLSTGNI